VAKVVGISGAQGGGKSSLLNELRARGWKVDDFRVSRAVQAQLGWEKLDRVMDSPDTMVQFQKEVWRQKTMHDQALREDGTDDIILTERTFADICAYSCNWGWKHSDKGTWTENAVINWVGEISHLCFASQKLYAGVVLLPFMADTIKWEDDPNRASRSTVDTIYEEVERFTQTRSMFGIKHYTITAKSVSDRADQVETFVRTL